MRTRCNEEVMDCSAPEKTVDKVCVEKTETQKPYEEVEDENGVATWTGPTTQLTKLLVFHENEATTGTHHLLQNSQSMMVVNEIVELVLNCVMEMHLDKVAEEFFVIDENGQDIENIAKDLQYSSSDKSLMVKFHSHLNISFLTINCQ